VSLADAEIYASSTARDGESPAFGSWSTRRKALRAAKEFEIALEHQAVLTRLDTLVGRSLADLTASLVRGLGSGWQVGAGARVRELVAEGRVEERGGLLYRVLGAKEEAASEEEVPEAPAQTTTDRLLSLVETQPGLTAKELADQLGVTPNRIGQIGHKVGLVQVLERVPSVAGGRGTTAGRWFPRSYVASEEAEGAEVGVEEVRAVQPATPSAEDAVSPATSSDIPLAQPVTSSAPLEAFDRAVVATRRAEVAEQQARDFSEACAELEEELAIVDQILDRLAVLGVPGPDLDRKVRLGGLWMVADRLARRAGGGA
jgi:hypothetical protein